jgi:cysteine-rich repeat protein
MESALSRVALAIAAVLAGCVRSDQVTCADGTLCPHGMVCDTAHGGCVTPAQLTACSAGEAFGTPCQAGAVTGECFDGVCLAPGCGNHVVEPGEQCDPPTPGHGCSADCKSNETCGNGVLDAVTSEQCDDGNRRNHDGCDSLCRTETLQFSTVPYAPQFVTPVSAVMDEASGVLLHVAFDTWGWDGTRWSLLATVQINPVALVYDTDRARVVALVNATAGTLDAFEWDGTTWAHRAVQNPPPARFQTLAAYDTSSHTVLVFDGGDTYQLDLVGADWTKTPAPNVATRFQQMIHDRARRVSMLVGGDGTVSEWSGTQWVAAAAPKLPQVGSPAADLTAINLVYDSDRGHVVAWGGCRTTSSPVACTNEAYRWDGPVAGWTLIGTTAPMPPSANAEIGFDVLGHRTVFVTGFVGAVAKGQVWMLDASGWTLRSGGPTLGAADGTAVYANGSVVFASDWSDTWIRSGADWTQVPASASANVPTLAYDPIRGLVIAPHALAIVNFVQTNELMALDATTGWSAMATPSPTGSFLAMTFDPAHRRLVAVTFDGTYALDSSLPDSAASAWTRIADGPLPRYYNTGWQLAFDASCGCLVFVQSGNTALQVDTSIAALDGETWVQQLSPTAPYAGTQWSARGDVALFPGEPGPLFEHRSSTTSTGAVSPLRFFGATYDDPLLGLVGVGSVDGFVSEYMISYRGPGGDELCDGRDGDGDGLVDCADPDCWWKCTPACPPGAC